jgi:hypothetical protein
MTYRIWFNSSERRKFASKISESRASRTTNGGERPNLVDFAGKQYGPGFMIATGMQGPCEERGRQHLLVVQTAVNVFEQRYA